jgi:hypothetical protein
MAEGVLGTLDTAYNLAKDLLNLHDAVARQAIVSQLQKEILSALESAVTSNRTQAAQIDEIRALKEEVARLEAWDAEKQNYVLKDVGLGNVAHVLKDGVQTGEAPHQLCANCFADGEKSFLKRTMYSIGHDEVLSCGRCGAEMYVKGMKRPEHSGGKSPGHAGAFGRTRR